MLLLLGILKRNHKYYMNVVDTDKETTGDDYRYVNAYALSKCANVSYQSFLSHKVDPRDYLKGEFDVSCLFVDENKLKDRINDFQIVSVYYDEENKPCLYKAIDRAGNISMHDVSELDYTKNSLFGTDINNLPSFVEHKTLDDAYSYFRSHKLDETKIANMPVGLAKHYLIGTRGFKEGYHTVTEVNHDIPLTIHEYMIFKGSATIKLVEYIPNDKTIFLTKQDYFSNPYPKERTVGFASNRLILLGSRRLMTRFCRIGTSTDFAFYNHKAVKLSVPLDQNSLVNYDKYIKSFGVYNKWGLEFSKNLTSDIYANILPEGLYNLPSRFYRDIRSMPFSLNRSYRLEEENANVETWIHTVALFISWQYYSSDFKKRIQPIIDNYQEIYQSALNNLVKDIGPRDTLLVMKWMKDNLGKAMNNILNSDISTIDENNCLFSFYQNNYDLPDNLKVYSEDAILNYGGLEKLKEDYDTSNEARRIFIINTLERIEKSLVSGNVLENNTNKVKAYKK